MPRKPTAPVRQAREAIRRLAGATAAGPPLPAVRELGQRFQLHGSTIFRLCRELAEEGVLWQNAAGRFYPAGGRKRAVAGAPVCVLGRSMPRWSRLYQEILEGVNEVCAANNSPLVLMTAPRLVLHPDPALPPHFASAPTQTRELRALLQHAPRGCAAYLLDHLWQDRVLAATDWPGGERVRFLGPVGDDMPPTVSPDLPAGARLTLTHLQNLGYAEIWLLQPFRGDPAVTAMENALIHAADGFPMRTLPAPTPPERARVFRQAARGTRRIALVCCEDNVCLELLELWRQAGTSGRQPGLMALQGTGVLSAPMTRLRYDYRRLGRSAAALALHGQPPGPVSPHLIEGLTCRARSE